MKPEDTAWIGGAADDTPYRELAESLGSEYEAWSDSLPEKGCFDQDEPVDESEFWEHPPYYDLSDDPDPSFHPTITGTTDLW